MKISILGGGSEIGASCLHVHIAGTDLLIDAGMRVHGDDLLPSFGMLDRLGKPQAVFVTHAHADHIGALPIAHRLFPEAPIFTTPPTADLMQIMMRDSFKIMERRCMETRALLPYTKEQMQETLQSVRLLPARGSMTVGNASIRWYRAGHILGAVMFVIEGGGEKLLVSGDLSFKAGRTIPGAEVPAGERPDVVILESTYGNRRHSDRNTEEKRLADNVAEVIASGGFALIPAFALGRAQEVMLILQDYMNRGLIPEFPIYVDGLVTPISKIYRRYPQYLKGPVAHRIRLHGDAFLTEGRCTAVQPKEREAVLQGKPACIIASSGMLIGGASVWYAERLIGSEKNAIFITGYQDEESPGRKLLNLADGETHELELNGTGHEVKCWVGKYGLSAHGDAGELNRFIGMLKPAHTLLVHGDEEARFALNESMDPQFHPILAENGEAYPFARRQFGKGVLGKRAHDERASLALKAKIGSLILYRKDEGGDLKLALCTGVYGRTRSLICQTPKGKPVRLPLEQVAETIGQWNRSADELREDADPVFTFSRPFLKAISWADLKEGTWTFEEAAAMCRLKEEDLKRRLALAFALQSLPEPFRYRDPNGTKYRIDRASRKKLSERSLPVQGLKMNATLAMDKIRDMLGGHPHFIRCGVDAPGTGDEHITLYFDFPHAVGTKERERLLREIEEATGWPAAFSDSVRTDLLQARISELLGPVGSPSIYLDDRRIVLDIARPADAEAMIEKIKKETGFALQFKDGIEVGQKGQHAESADMFRARTSSRRLENNQAIEEAKTWARDRNITLYKASIKQKNGQTYMEVHFITPEIARRHTVDMEELSYRTGLPITYARNPKQNEVIRIASEQIPESWRLRKNPSLHTGEARLSVKLPHRPSEEEVKRVGEQIKARTGYQLSIQIQ
ncbi:MBL fold metallo-hydrolase [Sporolactobacillus sp. THM7-7]|nr:MBL fold metallo-hydrolase [Sporolactobacillus sp. THM7-7]